MGKSNQNFSAPGGKNKGIVKKKNQNPCQVLNVSRGTNHQQTEGEEAMNAAAAIIEHAAVIATVINSARKLSEKVTLRLAKPTDYQVMRTTLAMPNHNTKTTHHETATHKKWRELPQSLKFACIEPPETYGTEAEIDERTRPNNPDIPDNMAFYAQGSERKNPVLDDIRMDDRCFREYCVQTQGSDPVNLFLEPKHGMSYHNAYPLQRVQPEIGPPSPFAPYKKTVKGRFTRSQTFHDTAWLANKLRCSFELAFELKEAFKSLNISTWQQASRIINGIVGSGQIVAPFKVIKTELKGVKLPSAKGLISYSPKVGPPNIRGLSKAIKLLATLAKELEDVTIEWPPMTNLDLHEDCQDLYADDFWAGVELEVDEVPFINDDLDELGGDSNPYTAHALKGDGTDSLPLIYWAALKNANDFQLSSAAQKMRPYRMEVKPPVWACRIDCCVIDPELNKRITGIVLGQFKPKKLDEAKRYMVLVSPGVYRKPNCGLTQDQTSHFWGLWHDRRAEITKAIKLSPEAQRYARNLAGIKARNRAAAYLYCLKNGTQFKERQDIIHPAGLKVIPTVIKSLWAQFNAQFPK